MTIDDNGMQFHTGFVILLSTGVVLVLFSIGSKNGEGLMYILTVYILHRASINIGNIRLTE